MTRSHDNAYSRVNECQSRATASNDANTLLGNKRKLPCVSFVCPTFFTARKENVALTSNENSSARIVASSDRWFVNVLQLSVDVASRDLYRFNVLLSSSQRSHQFLQFSSTKYTWQRKRKIRLNVARYRSTAPQSVANDEAATSTRPPLSSSNRFRFWRCRSSFVILFRLCNDARDRSKSKKERAASEESSFAFGLCLARLVDSSSATRIANAAAASLRDC